MKLATFIAPDGGTRPGVVADDRILAIINANSIRELLASGAAPRTGAAFALTDVRLTLPIPDPAKILCVGVNYHNRNEEYKDGSELPRFPSLFMRTPLSFVAPGEALLIPRESEQLDYEGEIVLVIGRSGRRIAAANAMHHVAGLTIMNEGTVRDWLRHGKFNVTQGKNFDSSGSVGPWIETEIPAGDISLETRVNGELRQSATTASLIFPFARIIEYISTFCTLLPGDLIATGTPTGAGARFDPPRWLRPGDEVTVTVSGVGALRNTVAQDSV